MQSMRIELQNGNDAAAIKMFNDITQDQVAPIPLPTREKKGQFSTHHPHQTSFF